MLKTIYEFYEFKSDADTVDFLILSAGLVCITIGATAIFFNAIFSPTDEIYVGLYTVGQPNTLHTYDERGSVVSEENNVIAMRYEWDARRGDSLLFSLCSMCASKRRGRGLWSIRS